MSLITEGTVYRRALHSGTIQVIPQRGDYALETLFEIAERRNPKRAFLFVSKVLGRHIPVAPRVMRQVYRQLAGQFPASLPEPVLFIGMAETAVGLGAGVFDEVRRQYRHSVYLTSTRHPVEGELLCEFKEEHSHATDHLIYLPESPENASQGSGRTHPGADRRRSHDRQHLYQPADRVTRHGKACPVGADCRSNAYRLEQRRITPT
ncbi:Uncharacterised protein [Serratia rubidaea]|uniref:Orotate phosphoribosyltransferase-like domain-containing protein n=1 Tax=Serratia rubidaea TaxID=61652 RepID=A0A4U9H9R0_SERRU|nr:Uncharacterised protein [Serratia rubidaea]